MTDLNTAIVDFKGWKSFGNYCVAPWVQYDSDENIINHSVDKPDYEHDANLYMALFEVMPRPALRKWGNRWYCMPDMDRSSKVQWVEYDADTIGTAICLAYCKLKGIKVVG